jgi:hypothetical protein
MHLTLKYGWCHWSSTFVSNCIANWKVKPFQSKMYTASLGKVSFFLWIPVEHFLPYWTILALDSFQFSQALFSSHPILYTVWADIVKERTEREKMYVKLKKWNVQIRYMSARTQRLISYRIWGTEIKGIKYLFYALIERFCYAYIDNIFKIM